MLAGTGPPPFHAGLPLAWRRIQAETIEPALTARAWGLAGAARRELSHAVLMRAGRGHVEAGDERLDFAAVTLVWIPARTADILHVEAGGAGHLLGIGDDLLTSALGNAAEAAALRQIVTRRLVLKLAPDDVVAAEARRSFAAIERELAAAARGSWTSIAAHLVLLIVALWRASGVEAVARHTQGPTAQVLQRFRHQVELHFRDHWSIPRYAEAIAVSSDRLHALCTRELGRPPLKLVHERIVREAQLLLARSVLTVEQVSTQLGFSDPAHFNRFFKKATGVPPGAFRRSDAAAPASALGLLPSYADWP
jgi:AraC-like DNA-binding protein